MEALYDNDPAIPALGQMYLHCKRCVEEFQTGAAPPGTTPATYARLSVAVTQQGDMQVWCHRHGCNVAVITFVHRRDNEPAATVNVAPLGAMTVLVSLRT